MITIWKVLISFGILFFGYVSSQAQNADIEILKSIHLNRNTGLDNSFKFLSKTATPASIGIPVTLGFIGFIKKDSLLKKNALKSSISIVATMALSTVLKYSINRTRPYDKYNEIKPLSDDFTASFPSGHTSSVFSTATTLSLHYPKWYVVVPSYTWASAVAYSRLHMGMHYPSDILAGMLVGIGTSYLSYYLQKKLFK